MASKRTHHSSVAEADEVEMIDQAKIDQDSGEDHQPSGEDRDPDRDLGPGPSQLAASSMGDLVDPDGIQGTRFTGPLLSGPKEDAGLPGIVLLHRRAKITFTNGSFSVPVVFPPSTIVTQLVVQIQQSYNGVTPKLNIGSALNGLDVASVDLSVAPTQVFNNLTTVLGSNWTLYLSQALGAGNTAGKCTALIYYSAPAKTLYS